MGFTFSGDLAGARTQDPLLKREMLYQLSYQVKMLKVVFLQETHRYSLRGCKYTIYNLFFKTERVEIYFFLNIPVITPFLLKNNRMIIVLTGYMGSGKSVVGKLLAHTLGLPFVDLDEYIESELQESISQVFSNKGELYFRKKEHEYLQKVLENHERLVLATGGGTPCYSGNMEFLLEKTPYVFYLQVSVPELARRLSIEKQHRPIISHLNDDSLPEYIAKHLFERNPFYMKANHTKLCDGKSIEEIVKEIEDDLV